MRRMTALTVTATLAGMLLGACRKPPEATLIIDSAHSQVGQPEGQSGLNYLVHPVQVLTVDARSFDFARSLFPNVRPNAIQLVVGKDRQYSARWDPSGLTTLSADTLTALNDSPVFPGLMAGDQAVLAIGEERIDEKQRQLVLKALWVGLVDVK